MRLPNLIIIGAKKCGTTSLHYYLGLHPEVRMARDKELYFFVEECNWPKGIDWYKSRFKGQAKIAGEASPNYSTFPLLGGVPERMHSVIPDAKLIYLVRDPIERMMSDYVHDYSKGEERRDVESALLDWTAGYIYRSMYFLQVEQYLEYFPASSLAIVAQEDLRDRRRETLQTVFRFLEVDESFYCSNYEKSLHASSDKRKKSALGEALSTSPIGRAVERLPQFIRWRLKDYLYRPFSTAVERPIVGAKLRLELCDRIRTNLERFRELSGREFEEWSV